MLSIYDIKHIMPFLDNKNVNNFCVLNKRYNIYTQKYIDRKIKNTFYNELITFKKIRKDLLNNWNLLKNITYNQKKKMRLYLNYINSNNIKIKNIIDYVYNNESNYELDAIIKLCDLFGPERNNDNNINIFLKFMIERNKKTCKSELQDSITDRIGLTKEFINNTKYYIELYINKKIQNIDYLYNFGSWVSIYKLINKYV
tara:strand:+ start:412 stop:1011 length:600 start_codon:yes stop_codon:yes gene_type:complete